MSNIDFTIGVPTFNRINNLKYLVAQIMPYLDSKKIRLFVIDDHSSDGTDSYFDNNKKDSIKFIRNSVNKGYCLNFLNLIRETDTKYLIITADDDVLVPDGLEKITNFIRRKDPDFVCTKYFRNDKHNKIMYRGKCDESKIPIREAWSSSGHAPGLVYKVEKIKPFLPYLEKLIQQKSTMAWTYPQVLCVTWLLATGGSGYYMDADIISEGDECPSGIKDEAGSYYWEEISAIKQYLSYNQFLSQIQVDFSISCNSDFNFVKKKAGEAMFSNLKNMLEITQPDFFQGFLESARRVPDNMLVRLMKLPYKLLLNPSYYFRKILNKYAS